MVSEPRSNAAAVAVSTVASVNQETLASTLIAQTPATHSPVMRFPTGIVLELVPQRNSINRVRASPSSPQRIIVTQSNNNAVAGSPIRSAIATIPQRNLSSEKSVAVPQQKEGAPLIPIARSPVRSASATIPQRNPSSEQQTSIAVPQRKAIHVVRRRLEYRGYDSAGISIDATSASVPAHLAFRQEGNIESLVKSVYNDVDVVLESEKITSKSPSVMVIRVFSLIFSPDVMASKKGLSGGDAIRSLKCSQNLEDFQSVDIVIEAIVESESVKKKLFVVCSTQVIGNAVEFDETRTLRPYKWAQYLAGIDFLPEVSPLLGGSKSSNEETAKQSTVISGLSMYRQQNRLQTVVQRIRARKKARLALAEQFVIVENRKFLLISDFQMLVDVDKIVKSSAILASSCSVGVRALCGWKLILDALDSLSFGSVPIQTVDSESTLKFEHRSSKGCKYGPPYFLLGKPDEKKLFLVDLGLLFEACKDHSNPHIQQMAACAIGKCVEFDRETFKHHLRDGLSSLEAIIVSGGSIDDLEHWIARDAVVSAYGKLCFEVFGLVELVQLPTNPGHCKVLGFVQFTQHEHAKAAQSLNGKCRDGWSNNQGFIY